jgi:hypothetical protein
MLGISAHFEGHVTPTPSNPGTFRRSPLGGQTLEQAANPSSEKANCFARKGPSFSLEMSPLLQRAPSRALLTPRSRRTQSGPPRRHTPLSVHCPNILGENALPSGHCKSALENQRAIALQNFVLCSKGGGHKSCPLRIGIGSDVAVGMDGSIMAVARGPWAIPDRSWPHALRAQMLSPRAALQWMGCVCTFSVCPQLPPSLLIARSKVSLDSASFQSGQPPRTPFGLAHPILHSPFSILHSPFPEPSFCAAKSSTDPQTRFRRGGTPRGGGDPDIPAGNT